MPIKLKQRDKFHGLECSPMQSEAEKILSERGFTRFIGGRANLFSPNENTGNSAVLILGLPFASFGQAKEEINNSIKQRVLVLLRGQKYITQVCIKPKEHAVRRSARSKAHKTSYKIDEFSKAFKEFEWRSN